MDLRRATEMVRQGLTHLAGLEHEDATLRMAALDRLAKVAAEQKAAIQARLDAKLAALDEDADG